MKYILMMFLSLSANAVTLDQAVDIATKKLAPQPVEGSIGYDIEWREEMGFYWINISREHYSCKEDTTAYSTNGVINVVTEKKCGLYPINTRNVINSLYQVMCYHTLKGKACKDRLAKELTASLIETMVAKDIHDVYVK